MSHLNSSGRSLSRADSQMTRVKNGQGTEGSARAVGCERDRVPPPLPYIPAARKTTVKMTVGRRGPDPCGSPLRQPRIEALQGIGQRDAVVHLGLRDTRPDNKHRHDSPRVSNG